MDRIYFTFESDADIVLHERMVDGAWVVINRWIIPGTEW